MDGKLRNEIRAWPTDDDEDPSLAGFLSLVRNRDLRWVVTYLEAVQRPDSPTSILDVERSIQESPNGVTYSWEDLEDLADRIVQCIDIDIIGYDPADLKRSSPRIMITAFDFCFWSIEFERFEDVDLSTVPSLFESLSAWERSA